MIQRIENLDLPQLQLFAGMTDAQLRRSAESRHGVFVAESPKVIATALNAGHRPLALLCEERHIAGDAAGIISRCGDIPVYTGSRELLSSLTGYTLTRGVLCAMERPEVKPVDEVVKGARLVAVIDGVCDTTNIGAIFRSAAALGVDAVLLTPTSCDPLNRRSIRVSMGSVFLVPWTWLSGAPAQLRGLGFAVAAMALRSDSVDLDDPGLRAEPRLAVVLGTEGDGLADSVIDSADYTVCIPMAHGVDSLNVAAASAVAFYALRR